ncbi:hypothetical protein C8T65DRAFT_635262 [Cerioporus squamosus]|nr:hypothetical protein C8T65DRAFT_635262 [Cerioporus squamosus]
MAHSAESLSFPLELAPLARTAKLPWPHLKILTLARHYSDALRFTTRRRHASTPPVHVHSS